VTGERIADIAAALDAARTRDGHPSFIGYVELACEGPRCAVRDVRVFFKEYDEPLPPRLCCPACRRPLHLRGVMTVDEYEADVERDARMSVNEQLWCRAHPGELAMPLGVFLDE
jgi:hypothetical protein